MEIIFEDRAMVIRSEDTLALIISDLHLGYETSILEEKGIQFPAQHDEMLTRIGLLVKKYDVMNLYILGDVKHTIMTDFSYNWDVLPEFMTNLTDIVTTTIIPGNHDGNLEPLLPRSVGLEKVQGVILSSGDDRVGLMHGHAWPAPSLLDSSMIVQGHSHPSVSRYYTVSSSKREIESKRRYAGSVPVILQSKLNKNCVRGYMNMKKKTDEKDVILVTLPSFNKILSGISINTPKTKLQGPFFDNRCADFINSEVFSLDGLFLGTVDWFRERFNETIKSMPSGD